MNKSSVDFETALSLVGFGKYQWTLLLTSGLTYMAFCYQGILTSVVGPAAQCDLNMTSKDQGNLHAAFIIGGVSSAIVWGILADQYGRRRILLISLAADAIFTIGASLSQSYIVLLVCRFLSGFFLVAPGCIILTYLVESVGETYRSKCVISMGAFCTVAFVALPLLAIAILPIEWSYESPRFKFNSWKILMLVSALPSTLSMIFLFTYLYESPKFLYSQGNVGRALYVMEKMYYVNYGNSKGPFPIRDLVESEAATEIRKSVILDPDDIAKLQNAGDESLRVILSGMWRQARTILQPPYIYYSLMANALLFTCLYGYYGLALWLPVIFRLLEEHSHTSSEPLPICDLIYLRASESANETMFNLSERDCHPDYNINVYINTFIIGVVTVISNVLFAFTESYCGVKLLTVLTMLVSACCALAVYFVNTTLLNLIASCVFLSFAEAATMFLQSAASDMFPTKIRGLAMCVAWLSGRVGSGTSSLITGSYIDTFCELPLLSISGGLFVGTLLSLFLPSHRVNAVI